MSRCVPWGALEQDRAVGLLDGGGNVAQVWDQPLGHGHDLVEHGFRVHGFAAVEVLEQNVLFLQRGRNLGLEQVRVGKVTGADAATVHLVLVARADASAGGADLGVPGLGGFARAVHAAVVRHDDVGLRADHQPAGGHVNALGVQLVQFLAEDDRVQDHAVADEALLARMKDTRGDEVQDALLAVDHQGVPRVVAALETDDGVRALGEHVDDLAFALVSPLGAENHDIGHLLCSLK